MPAACSASPPCAAFGLGSRIAATTRLTFAFFSASTQGGVRPWWLHGSRLTYTVAPACLRAGRLLESHNFGMRPAGALVPALADDFFSLGDDATDARIRRGGVEALLREFERAPHHGVVERRERGH